MKIQQHDGVVVDAGVTAAGLRHSTTRGRGVAGEREAPRVQGAAAPPPLYIGSPRGGAGPRIWDLLGPPPWGAYIKGGGAAAPLTLGASLSPATPLPLVVERRSPAAVTPASTTTPSCCWIFINVIILIVLFLHNQSLGRSLLGEVVLEICPRGNNKRIIIIFPCS